MIGRVKHEPHGDVTYSNQIARILQKRCQECHRAGEVAPFAMDSYDEIVGWAETIREVVNEGRMPPWFASPAHGTFGNDARLTAEEKELVSTWVANGCPEGDRAQLPSPHNYAQGWRIGEPDQVIYMADEPHNVPAEGTVAYKYFTVDPGWKEDKWVQATESRPGSPAVVHHIIVFILRPGSDDAMMSGLGGFAPGNPVDVHPPGVATFVPANSKLLFQLHYTPNGTETSDRSMIGVKFADPKTVKKKLYGDAVGNLMLKIPPGEPNYEVEAHAQVPPRHAAIESHAAHAPARKGFPLRTRISRWPQPGFVGCAQLGLQLADSLRVHRADPSPQGRGAALYCPL